jgi:hypothetical protein
MAARGIDNMQTLLPENVDDQHTAVSIREQETENYTALIHEIWRRFTNESIAVRRSEFKIDASTNP